MACRGKELLSLFLYKICNPKRSDYKIEEQVDEPKAEEEHKMLQAEHKMFEAEHNKLGIISKSPTISESYSGPLEEKKKTDENANEGFCLPSDVVVLILSRLALKDNIRSSAVCKTWGEIASSVRVRDRSSWLMYLDPRHVNGVSYGFFDPVEKKKTKAMSLPELSESSRILYSNDGWLLMIESSSLFFFNPFTRERINLPGVDTMATQFAFSCAPTKRGCLVFALKYFLCLAKVTISTWHPGATTWVHENFPVDPSYSRHARNVLYSNGLFYVASEIALEVYDSSARTWDVLPVQPITTPSLEMHTIRWITEYEGQIFLVDASTVEPMVFRLNRLESVWEKKETLDGSSIFVSNGSCVMTSGLTGSMSNIVYIWSCSINWRRPTKYGCSFRRNRPYKYSLYSRSLCEDTEGYYFEYRTGTQMDGVWIETPHNISIFDYSILPSHAINMRLFI